MGWTSPSAIVTCPKFVFWILRPNRSKICGAYVGEFSGLRLAGVDASTRLAFGCRSYRLHTAQPRGNQPRNHHALRRSLALRFLVGDGESSMGGACVRARAWLAGEGRYGRRIPARRKPYGYEAC